MHSGLHLARRTVCLLLLATLGVTAEPAPVRFHDVSSQVGLISTPTLKYGGPCVADIDNDGRYDFLLGNHDQTPIQFFLAEDDGAYSEQRQILYREDVHGITAGDYDRDGDLDVVVSLGGGNATNPKPPRLLNYDDGRFTDVTVASGIAGLGARGRSVRWVDLDLDGHLDLLQINAAPAKEEVGPRNILFKNRGDSTFEYVSSPAFEDIEAEKVFITDFNGDHTPDVITFSPGARVGFWRGNKDFTFTDVTAEWLPSSLHHLDQVTAMAEADIDGDGDFDYYLARGMSGFQVSRNNVCFHDQTGRLDLRDAGTKGHDGISFETWGPEVDLIGFDHFARPAHRQRIPVFLGEARKRIATPLHRIQYVSGRDAAGFPSELEDTGWYLGHLGDNRWRLEWLLNEDIGWMIRCSLIKVRSVQPDWEPLDTTVPDVLLRNEGDHFTDLSADLPGKTADNNQGVVTGDFNNDGLADFFLFRFGEGRQRIPDVILIDQGDGTYVSRLDHGATALNQTAHGDMGAAFDFDLDGDVDILSGDDDDGTWHLFQNRLKERCEKDTSANHLLVRVGYAESGVDPLGALITVATTEGAQVRRVGSGSAAFSQCLLNTAHFGLGDESSVVAVKVRWRDGSQMQVSDCDANRLIQLGSDQPGE
jgi:hypothetical protein